MRRIAAHRAALLVAAAFVAIPVAAPAATLLGGGPSAGLSAAECPTLQRDGEGAVARPSRPVTRVERELVQRAAEGDAEAAFAVGRRYFDGVCVHKSFAEAHRWFAIAAAAGHACAAAAASYLRGEGLGVERDPRAARDGLRAAQEAGCRRAYYLQATLEEQSLRPDRRTLARELLERGAELGDGHALNALAAQREMEEDRGAAEALYQRAAAAGNRAAKINLKRLDLYFSQRERKESIDSLRQGAAAGRPAAMFSLAQRYHRGDGVAVDYVAALRLYRLAAEAGSTPAAEMLRLILSRPGPRESGGLDVAWMQQLAFVPLATDEQAKRRGVLQPVIDDDPFYDMAP